MKSTRSVLLARRATATFYGIVGESWGPWVSSSDGCKMFRPQAQSRLSRAAACGTTLARRTGVGTRERSEGLGLRPRAWPGTPRRAPPRTANSLAGPLSRAYIQGDIYPFAVRLSPLASEESYTSRSRLRRDGSESDTRPARAAAPPRRRRAHPHDRRSRSRALISSTNDGRVCCDIGHHVSRQHNRQAPHTRQQVT